MPYTGTDIPAAGERVHLFLVLGNSAPVGPRTSRTTDSESEIPWCVHMNIIFQVSRRL
jgi:hypothetical protein